MSRPVVIVAARRTPVAPRGGAFTHVSVGELGAATIRAILTDAGLSGADVGGVILGNALYGGGNPGRVCALAAGLPEAVSAFTVDTQCCAGLDAVSLAAARIAAGDADVMIAGGVESFSRAPIRQHRPVAAGGTPIPYERPPFTPWPDRDPDMLEAAAVLAARRGISRAEQEAFAVESHRRARADDHAVAEIVPVADTTEDTFTRDLTAAACARLPIIAGDAETGITAATTAVEADAAAALLLMSEDAARHAGLMDAAARIVAGVSVGSDPAMPATAPADAMKALSARTGIAADAADGIELMEAFAVQALDNMAALSLDPGRVNQRGGALARGHPIGASGAILLVRLFHDLSRGKQGRTGLAAIAGAGGLGSAMLLRKGGA